MNEYHKIKTLFKRDERTKKLLVGQFTDPTIEMLKDIRWRWTEKVDGTNIRIGWDGHKVTIGGRTDRAQIPSRLIAFLSDKFLGEANAQLLEQKFDNTEVILFGEGYGAGIQKGGDYRDDCSFIMFDAICGNMFLERESVNDIASYFGIDVVPELFSGTIQEAVDYVREMRKSTLGKRLAPMEGIVGRPERELLDRRGNRLVVKLKHRDFD